MLNATPTAAENQENIMTINGVNKGVQIVIQNTGMGINEQRAKQLNGIIVATSILNVGSTFTINLPTLNTNNVDEQYLLTLLSRQLFALFLY